MTNFRLDQTLKAFVDDKLYSAEIMISVYERVEIILGKGANAGYQHFLLFPLCFQKVSFSGSFNPLTDDKILDQTKLKAFADDKLHATKMIISVFDRVENIVGKGEIACTSNFSFSHSVFKRLVS